MRPETAAQSPFAALERIGSYRRVLRTSVAGIWENVLDWEHIPWLHAELFRSVELLDRREDGWTARVGIAGDPSGVMVLDMAVDRTLLRYTATTIGEGGVEACAVTTLTPQGVRSTAIRVEFFAVPVSTAIARMKLVAYERVYRQLWDEDEAMIVRQEEVAAQRDAGAPPPARVAIGSAESLAPRLPCIAGSGANEVLLSGRPGAIRAFRAVCPHRGGPLGSGRLCGGAITCPWHGYSFDVETGRSADGRGFSLEQVPVEVDPASGQIVVSG